MSGFSTNLAQKVANHFFRKVTQPMTPATYLALFVADPTDENVTANEVVADWYVRQEIPSWSAPVEMVIASPLPIPMKLVLLLLPEGLWPCPTMGSTTQTFPGTFWIPVLW